MDTIETIMESMEENDRLIPLVSKEISGGAASTQVKNKYRLFVTYGMFRWWNMKQVDKEIWSWIQGGGSEGRYLQNDNAMFII